MSVQGHDLCWHFCSQAFSSLGHNNCLGHFESQEYEVHYINLSIGMFSILAPGLWDNRCLQWRARSCQGKRQTRHSDVSWFKRDAFFCL